MGLLTLHVGRIQDGGISMILMSRTALIGINFNTECISFFDFVHNFFLWFCSYFFLWFCSYFFIVWSKNVTLLIFIVQNQFVDRKIIFVGGKIIFKNSIVQVKNVTHSQPAKCESKTWLTPGPERPFRCLELTASRQCASQKRDWRGVLRVKNVTDAGSRTTF